MDTFSITFHYGGKFRKKKNLRYVGGDEELVPNIDVDMVSIFVVVDMVVAVGAEVWKSLYYVVPPLELEDGLRKMETDNDVLEMVGALDDKRHIHMYVDHEGFDINYDHEEIVSSHESSGSSKADDGPQVGEVGDAIHADETNVVELGASIHISIPSVSASLDAENLSAVESDDTLIRTHTAESSNNSLDICLEDTFSSLAEIKKKIVNYAVVNGFDIRFTKHEKQRIEARCRDGCDWRLYASKVTNEESFKVKSLNDVHVCARTMESRHATAKWVAEHYVHRFRSQPRWEIPSIIETVRRDFNINISPSLAIRARRRVVNVDSTEQYKHLGSYAEEVLRSNPGSTFIINVDRVDGQTEPIFKRLYMCLDACKRGLLAGCRPIISLDGCHLKGACPGQLLTAIGVDANDGIYPVAVAVVDVECKKSWKWFMRLLLTDIGSDRGEGWTFISDQQKGLETVLQKHVPDAEVRFCVRHMYANFKKKFRGKLYKDIMWNASTATTREMFVKEMKRLRSVDEAAYRYLVEYDAKHWCRHAFSHRSKCELTLNNLSESFNAFILPARDKPIVTMIEMIRSTLMARICKRHERMDQQNGLLCPQIRKKLMKIQDGSRNWCATAAGDERFQVSDSNQQFVVDLPNYTCTCTRWQLAGIPCVHAVACISFMRRDIESYVDRCYHRQTYLTIYSQFIQPMNGIDMWPPSAMGDIQPLIVKRLPGRPKKKRTRDVDEPQGQSTRGKMRKVIKCSKCRGLNHNARTCKGVNNDFGMEAKASTSRGRSTLFGFSSAAIGTQESSVQPNILRG